VNYENIFWVWQLLQRLGYTAHEAIVIMASLFGLN